MIALENLDLKGKKVLMRVDFNVPLEKGKITDDTRIQEVLPTIKYILNQGGRLILMSHLGRPNGKRDLAFSLKPCADHLSELLKKPVLFAPDCVGKEVEKMASNLKDGSVLLLENLRFHESEEHPEKDPVFAQNLAKLGDIFVNDAFGTAHRAHASTYNVVPYFQGKAAMGLLMQKEISFLNSLLSQPQHPFYAIIGGAKISSKIGVLKALLDKVDGMFIGGGMAFTFLKAQGISIGDSLYEDSFLETAKDFLKACSSKKVSLFLPKDCLIADEFSKNAHKKLISIEQGIPPGWRGMDIGPETVKEWTSNLNKASTIFWNGPLGVFEFPSFSQGTYEIAKILAGLKAKTIVGGGDSVAAINHLHLAEKFTHVSTGGGATLEYIELGHLPGIDILQNN